MQLNNILQDFRNNEKTYGRRANITLIVGLVALLFAPAIISQLSFGISFEDTGQIGDTIGGITTPILTFIGSILVYYSFKQQLEANKIQISGLMNEKAERNKEMKIRTDDRIIDFCEKLADETLNEIKEFEYETPRVKIKGEGGIKSLYNDMLIDEIMPQYSNSTTRHIIDVIRILDSTKLLFQYVNYIEDYPIRRMFIVRYNNKIFKRISSKSVQSYLEQLKHKQSDEKIAKISIETFELVTRLLNANNITD
jgi:hypothetical protein